MGSVALVAQPALEVLFPEQSVKKSLGKDLDELLKPIGPTRLGLVQPSVDLDLFKLG